MRRFNKEITSSTIIAFILNTVLTITCVLQLACAKWKSNANTKATTTKIVLTTFMITVSQKSTVNILMVPMICTIIA